MKLLVAIALALCYLGSQQVQAQSCHLRELDLCAATLLLFNQGPGSIATTDDELNRQCGYIKEAYQCLRNFTVKCTTPLQRELINFVTEGADEHLNDFCTEGGELRTNFLKHAPCLREAYGDGRKCLTDLQVALEFITSTERKKRIPAACCTYQKFRGCLVDTVRNKCGDEAIAFMESVVNLIAANLPDALCSGFEVDGPKCEGLLPAPGTTPQGGRSNSVLSRLFAAYLGN